MIKINNEKSHKSLEIFLKMKKFVAFFQANPWLKNSGIENSSRVPWVWLGNSTKFREINNGI